MYRSGVLGDFLNHQFLLFEPLKGPDQTSHFMSKRNLNTVVGVSEPHLLSATLVVVDAHWQEITPENTSDLKIGRLITVVFVLNSQRNVRASCCRLRSHH